MDSLQTNKWVVEAMVMQASRCSCGQKMVKGRILNKNKYISCYICTSCGNIRIAGRDTQFKNGRVGQCKLS